MPGALQIKLVVANDGHEFDFIVSSSETLPFHRYRIHGKFMK